MLCQNILTASNGDRLAFLSQARCMQMFCQSPAHSLQTASYFESLGMLDKAIDMWRIVDVYRAGDKSVLMQLVRLYHL